MESRTITTFDAYDREADSLAARYESRAFEEIHSDVLDVLLGIPLSGRCLRWADVTTCDAEARPATCGMDLLLRVTTGAETEPTSPESTIGGKHPSPGIYCLHLHKRIRRGDDERIGRPDLRQSLVTVLRQPRFQVPFGLRFSIAGKPQKVLPGTRRVAVLGLKLDK